MAPLRDIIRVSACLSLSGRYARFGTQIANALEVWQSIDSDAELVLEDDRSDRQELARLFRRLVKHSDILLGPYSTQLMKSAARLASGANLLLWNHGGSGDDVETGFPGNVVSVLTPTGHYSEPFLHYLTSSNIERAPLWIVEGKGSFGRQVANGALVMARDRGIDVHHIDAAELANIPTAATPWDMFSAGAFEDDVRTVTSAQYLTNPPRIICAVAAGVHDFANEVEHTDGVFGVGQWFPDSAAQPELGPSQQAFLTRYAETFGTAIPDYPAIQAVAAAVIASHCARKAGTTTREALWSTATSLETSTLFGDFGVDPHTGMQLRHKAALTRWTASGLVHQPLA